MRQFNYFNLVDVGGEPAGILETTLSYEIVDLEWSMYNSAETSNHCIEEFIELMEEAYRHYFFNRFFIDSIIDPVDVDYLENKNESKININKLT